MMILKEKMKENRQFNFIVYIFFILHFSHKYIINIIFRKAKKRKRIKKLEGEDSDQESGEGSGSGDEQKKTGRKNIRKVKKSGNLDAATRIAAKKEKERLQRIAERQKLVKKKYLRINYYV